MKKEKLTNDKFWKFPKFYSDNGNFVLSYGLFRFQFVKIYIKAASKVGIIFSYFPANKYMYIV